MSDWLLNARAALKAVMTAGEGETWETWDYNPESLVAPAIAITYGSPLLEDGSSFQDYLVRFTVTLVPDISTNEGVTDALDRLIQTSVSRLVQAEYGIENVGQPYALELQNGARYFAVDLTVTTDVDPT